MMFLVNAFVSVYCDWSVKEEAVRAATGRLALPPGVQRVLVTTGSDTLGCRVAVDLVGTFDENVEGRAIARRYAAALSQDLGTPAFALCDLLTTVRTDW